MPSLTALLAFEAALRYGNFTRAGEELGRTQGAISRQVALLEQQLGVTLFSREGARITPTAVGRSYGAKLGPILDRLAALTLELQSSGEVGSVLNLAILPSFGTRWLIPRIPDFNRQHPAIRLHFTTRIGTFDFEAEGLDAAIHHGQEHWPGAQLDALMQEEISVVCREDLAARLKEPLDLRRLPRLQLQSRRRAWTHWFRNLDLDVADAGRGPLFEHHLMVIQAALAGLGVALLPTFLIEEELEAGRLVTPFPELIFPGLNGYYLAYPEASRQLPALVAFRDWISRELN